MLKLEEAPLSPTEIEERDRKKRSNLIRAGVVVLAVGALAALMNFDGLFFIILFIILIQSGLIYGCEGKGYVKSLEYLPIIVIALAVISLAAAGLGALYHFGAKQKFPFPEDIQVVTSVKQLTPIYNNPYLETFFVMGTVGPADRKGDEIVYGGKGLIATGPSELLIELSDGVLEVVNYRHAKNRYGKFVRILWPTTGMSGSQREYLESGETVSIRGEIAATYSLDNAEKVFRVSADEIYYGNTNGHKAVLIRNSATKGWNVFMAYAVKLWALASLAAFFKYGYALLQLRKSNKPQKDEATQNA